MIDERFPYWDMNNEYIILKEKNIENVKEVFSDLRLFNHYIIKDLNQIIDKDNVKYIINIEDIDFYIVVTKESYASIIEN